MMDLTPLDVRKKAADFHRVLRGYDPAEVDTFLQIVAERLEALVRENLSLDERVRSLREQMSGLEGRESAVQEALVVAHQLSQDVRAQAQREAELVRREAEAEARQRTAEMEGAVAAAERALADLEERRGRLVRSLRAFLQGELAAVEAEVARPAPDGGAPPGPSAEEDGVTRIRA